MFRLVCVTLALLHVAVGVDVARSKVESVFFTAKDVVPKGQTRVGGERASTFIGDLTIGGRLADETVFTRILELENRLDVIFTHYLDLNVENGVIHYVSVENLQGSQTVTCSDPKNLGQRKTRIATRVPPRSNSAVVITVAAH